MELKELSKFLLEKLPESAIDISESLELLISTIEDTINELHQKYMNTAIQNREFNKLNEYAVIASELDKYTNMIMDIKKDLEEEIAYQEDEVEDNKKEIPNYEEYLVDSSIVHTLYESFTHKRPSKMEFMGDSYEVKYWRDVTVNTCLSLLKIDRDKLLGFEFDKRMNGKKAKYFSKNEDDMRIPLKIEGTDVYIEGTMSANAHRNLIIKMLQRYNLKIADFKVYLRADYTDLHKK